jgi:hypothetical protein
VAGGSSGRTARLLVASILEASLDDEWTVYASWPEVVAAPAAVIRPRPPYREREAHKGERVNLTVLLMLPRPSDDEAFDSVDAWLDIVRADLELVDGVEVPAIGDIAPLQSAGGVEHLAGALDVTIHLVNT